MVQPKILKTIQSGHQIVFMESDENYTIIYLDDGKKLVSGYTLKRYQQMDDFNLFVRANRHQLVNMSFIKMLRVEKKANVLELVSGQEFLLSRRKSKLIINDYPNLVNRV